MIVAALIPCKKGSKGVPNKNFRDLCGKPMWQYTLDAARESDIFDLIVVSSNGGLNRNDYEGYTYYVNNEPDPKDDSSLDRLMAIYSEKKPSVDVWVLLQPTSVLRASSDISGAFSLFNSGFDSVVSVTPVGDKYWIRGADGFFIPMYSPECRRVRQDHETDVVYYENGAIYITKKWLLTEKQCRIGGNIGFYEMPEERSFQIDSPFDWKVVECALS